MTDEVKPMRVSNWTAEDDGITRDDVKAEVLTRRRVVSARLKPHIASMLDNAYTLVNEELRRLTIQQQAEDAKPISVDKLERLVRSLKTLQNAEIEQEKRDNPQAMMDDDVIHGVLKDPEIRYRIRRALDEYDD